MKVNILLGRFQPFTLGHLKCATKVYKTKNIPTVLCVIDTIKQDDRHPFLTKMLWRYFRKLTEKYDEIQDIVLVKNADILAIGKALGEKNYDPVTWTCGTDRYSAYNSMCKKYAPSVEVIEIDRSEGDISATQVRQCIKAGDEDGFKRLVPECWWSLFSKLKEVLDNL